jgi:hypothetical protein
MSIVNDCVGFTFPVPRLALMGMMNVEEDFGSGGTTP